MIYNLLTPFSEDFFLFNLARYHTFRAGAACMTALLICLIFGAPIIRWLRSFQRGGQPIDANYLVLLFEVSSLAGRTVESAPPAAVPIPKSAPPVR